MTWKNNGFNGVKAAFKKLSNGGGVALSDISACSASNQISQKD
jgi:hypothetical protein